MRLLKRWFGDKHSTTEKLRTFADVKLKPGLKRIVPKLSGGSLVITDCVPLRGETEGEGGNARRIIAFVVPTEPQEVVYIEKGFFHPRASAVFQRDERHWARIMVHEMSHRQCSTVDHRYAWAGIEPGKAGFTADMAMANADSWAIFVANAARAMSKTDISRARNGTVG